MPGGHGQLLSDTQTSRGHGLGQGTPVRLSSVDRLALLLVCCQDSIHKLSMRNRTSGGDFTV